MSYTVQFELAKILLDPFYFFLPFTYMCMYACMYVNDNESDNLIVIDKTFLSPQYLYYVTP